MKNAKIVIITIAIMAVAIGGYFAGQAKDNQLRQIKKEIKALIIVREQRQLQRDILRLNIEIGQLQGGTQQ